MSESIEFTAQGYAAIKVVDGALTSFLVAERVYGGWQAGVMNYPDRLVEEFRPREVLAPEELADKLAAAWDEGASAGYELALLEGPDSDYVAKTNPYRTAK